MWTLWEYKRLISNIAKGRGFPCLYNNITSHIFFITLYMQLSSNYAKIVVTFTKDINVRIQKNIWFLFYRIFCGVCRVVSTWQSSRIVYGKSKTL